MLPQIAPRAIRQTRETATFLTLTGAQILPSERTRKYDARRLTLSPTQPSTMLQIVRSPTRPAWRRQPCWSGRDGIHTADCESSG